MEQARKTAFVSELEIIQAKVSALYEEEKISSENKDFFNSIGQDISKANITAINGILQGKNIEEFRYFSNKDLEKIGLDNIKQNVIINFKTREVISLSGIKIDGKKYYRLVDIPNYSGYQVEYESKNINAQAFETEITEISNAWNVKLKNIEYKNNENTAQISYKLHENENWIINAGTNFTVTLPGLYDIRLTDKDGNSTTIQRFIQYNYTKDGLLAYLDAENFDISTPNEWKDLSENANNAIVEGIDEAQKEEWIQKEFKLDGKDDKITLPVNIETEDSITVEMVLTDYDHEKNAILLANNGWNAFNCHTYNSVGEIYIGGNFNADLQNRFTPTDIDYKTEVGKIFSLGYTYDSTTKTATVYINGNQVASKVYTNGHQAISSFIATANNKSYSRISIYNKALNAQEILDNYAIDKLRFNIEN